MYQYIYIYIPTLVVNWTHLLLSTKGNYISLFNYSLRYHFRQKCRYEPRAFKTLHSFGEMKVFVREGVTRHQMEYRSWCIFSENSIWKFFFLLFVFFYNYTFVFGLNFFFVHFFLFHFWCILYRGEVTY